MFGSFFRGKSFRGIALSLRLLCHNSPRRSWWLALSCRGHDPSPLGLGREWATYESKSIERHNKHCNQKKAGLVILMLGIAALRQEVLLEKKKQFIMIKESVQ